jgi:hypothetical protein
MTQRGRKTSTKQPAFTTSQPAASPDPTRAISNRHHASIIETPNGRYTRAQWRKLSAYERHWMKRERFLWPADMRKDA